MEKQYSFVVEHPDIAAVFCSYRRIGTSGKSLGIYSLRKDYVEDPLLQGFITHSTMLCSKSVFWSVGGYREMAYPVDDLDLTLRLQERFAPEVVEEPLIEYRFRSQSFTPNHLNTISMMRRYVRFCAVKRRQGMSEPELIKFLEQDLEVPFLIRLIRLIQAQGEFYRRLAISSTLGGQTFRGLYFLLLAMLMDPKDTFRRISSLFLGVFKKFIRTG